MATDLGTGYVVVKPSMSGFTSELSSGFGTAGTSSASLFSTKFAAVTSLVSSTISAVSSTISSSLGSAISRVDTLNQFPKVMENLGYSAEDAETSMTKLSEGIQGLPTTLDEIVGYTQSLVSTVGDLDTASDLALAMNDAMIAFGASSEGASTAITQLNQMISSGSYDTQSWLSINSAAPGLLDTIADAMLGESATMTTLQEALNDGTLSTEDFIEGLISLDQDGTDSMESFASTASAASGGIATSMSIAQTAVTTQLGNIISEIEGDEGRISGFFSGLKPVIADFGGQVTEWVGGAISTLEEFWGALEDSGAIETLSSTGETISGWAQSISSSVGTAVDEVRPSIQDVVDFIAGVVESVNGFVDSVGEYFAGLKSAYDESGLGDDIQTALDTVGGLLDDISGYASDAAEPVAEFFDSLVPTPEEVISGLESLVDGFKWLVDNADGISTACVSVATGLATLAAVQGISAVASGVSELFTAIGLASEAASAGGGIATFATSLGTLMSSSSGVGGVIGGLSTKIGGLFTAVSSAGGGLKGLITVLGGAISPVGLVVAAIAALVAGLVWFFTQTETGQEIWGQFTEFLGNVWSSVCEMVSGAIESIVGFFTSLPERIQNLWSTMWDTVKKKVSDVWGGIKEGVKDGIESVKEKIADIKETITGKFEDAKDWLVDAGSNILKGLTNGISDAVGGVIESVTGVATDVVDTVCDILGIKSPSRVFMGIGDYMMQGLAKGVERGVPDVVDTLSSAEAEFEGFGANVSMNAYMPALASAASSGSTTNVYIDGVQAAPDSKLYALADSIVSEMQTVNRRRGVR